MSHLQIRLSETVVFGFSNSTWEKRCKELLFHHDSAMWNIEFIKTIKLVGALLAVFIFSSTGVVAE